MSEYLSDELFHFVGHRNPTDHEHNFQTLIQILKSNCISSKPPEIGWGQHTVHLKRGSKLENEELVVSNITCYCDIPSDALNIHTAKYGYFGLSFERNLLIKYGARPVLYVPTRSDDWASRYGTSLLRDVEAVFEGFMRNLYDREEDKLSEHSRSLGSIPASEIDTIAALHSLLLKDFLAFIKPYNSELPKTHDSYFYAEREWRRIGSLMFTLQDVQSIALLNGYESRLREEMPEFKGRVMLIGDPDLSVQPGRAQ